MSQQKYNEEYVKFIKTFIANNCFTKYCSVVSEIEGEELYRTKLMEYKNDEEIWNKIMNEMHTPLKYLTSLYRRTKYGIPIHNINIYKQQTFQEYIDSIISLKTVGSYDYQRFIKSMQDENFKNKMVDKYNEQIYTNIIKNYIIYIIQLYLSRKIDSSPMFTDEEYYEMDISIDIIPYIEFLSSRNLGISNLCGYKYDDEEYSSENKEEYIKDNNTMEEEYNENLELEIIKYINNTLYK